MTKKTPKVPPVEIKKPEFVTVAAAAEVSRYHAERSASLACRMAENESWLFWVGYVAAFAFVLSFVAYARGGRD